MIITKVLKGIVEKEIIGSIKAMGYVERIKYLYLKWYD